MAAKPYFFQGHRKPSQNRPTVRGGLFTNRQTLKPPKPTKPNNHSQPVDLFKWDPELVQSAYQSESRYQSESQYQSESNSVKPLTRPPSFLSPIARFIVDAFRKNGSKWGPGIVEELNKIRATPSLVSEVLKVQTDFNLASKFFHWAGKQKGYRHDYRCYNAFAYCLNRTNRFRSADLVPDLMEAQGKPPSEKQFEILIRMHRDANRGLRVYHVYEKMKKFGVKPRVFLYNRVMEALVRTGYLDLAISVYEDFKEAGLVEESVTYMIVIKGLCRSGRVEEMLEVLKKMRVNLCKPDVFAYTAMVNVMLKEGHLDGALSVWDEMVRDGIEPDVVAYKTMIEALCKREMVEKGYDFFKEMKQKGILIDRAIYATLVDAFVNDGKVGSACDLFQDLVESGYRADLGIYGSIIRGLCEVKRVDKAFKLFQATVSEDLGPDFETVSPILLCYAETKDMDEFRKMLVQMERLGVSVLDGLSKFFSFVVEKKERTQMAVEVLEDLKLKGYRSVKLYNIVMEALHRVGMVTKALSLFAEMKSMNVKPDSLSYSLAIECFIEDERVKEACECYNKIIEMSCVPSVPAYLTLARRLCTIGEIDEAMMLVRDCLGSVESGPMEFKYTLTILNTCKSGKSEEVIEVLNEMMQQGCPPDDVIYSAVISGMCKHGTIEEAKKVFSNLRERKILSEPRMIMFEEILSDHWKKKTTVLLAVGVKFYSRQSTLRAQCSRLLTFMNEI